MQPCTDVKRSYMNVEKTVNSLIGIFSSMDDTKTNTIVTGTTYGIIAILIDISMSKIGHKLKLMILLNRTQKKFIKIKFNYNENGAG